MEIQIIELDASALEQRLEALSQILADSVTDGASISFMLPFSYDEANLFWLRDIRPQVMAGNRILFGALRGDELLGTVQLITDMPPNQPHRCEVAKMIVHPRARRLGIGRSLMSHALKQAHLLGKTLVTLDTKTGDVAESLYTSLGFKVAGTIPDYAWDSNGQAKHSTTYMYQKV